MLNEVFPFIDVLDQWLAVCLPLTVRFVFWGLAAGAAALALYALTSPQASITRLKLEAKELRSSMFDLELDATEFGHLTKRNLVVSFSLLLLVIGPTLLSAIPVLLFAFWLDTRQGFVFPDDAEPVVISASGDFSLKLLAKGRLSVGDSSLSWIPSSTDETVTISVDESVVYSGALGAVPTPVLYKAAWWNRFLASEVGYLSHDSPVEELYLSVKPKRLLGWGPSWLAGWEMLYFVSVLISALSVKIAFKIE